MPWPTPMLVATDPTSELADRVLRAYMVDVVSRYRRRCATRGEVDQAMCEDPSADLAPPTGLLVVAVIGEQPVGCGGVRLLTDPIAELTRVWVAAPERRRGYGAQIVEYLERHAAMAGHTRVRLDTRGDLIEARALYARLGYREVAPFNDGVYAEHWFEKGL